MCYAFYNVLGRRNGNRRLFLKWVTPSILEVTEMTESVENYVYLWDGSQTGWALLTAPELEGGYCIFDVANSTLLHIDDSALNAALCQRMRAAGCEVIDDPVNASIGVETVKPD